MGAQTDNAKKAARGYDSILRNGIFAQHMEWFVEEYKTFPSEVLERWMEQDPDSRGDVDIPESEVFDEIAHRIQYYDYYPEERGAFQQFFARLIVLDATKKLCKKLGTDFESAEVELFDTDVSHLIVDLAQHIVLKDKRIDDVERDMYYQSVIEGKPIAKIAEENNCSISKVERIIAGLNKQVLDVQMEMKG